MTEESLFHEALARAPADRAAYLSGACAGRPGLRAAVEALLSAHDLSGEFLNGPPVAALVESDVTAALETDDRAGPTDPASRPASSATADDAGTTQTAGPVGPVPSAVMPDRIGRYVVQSELGRGGMGTVYLAHDPELDRRVALKVPQVAGPDAGERFLREARAAAQLAHPNLCPVFDAGRADGLLYLAMAYVPGDTLAQVLQRDGRPPIERAATIAIGVARGMAEAHRHGIVHRDLKPGNILFDRNGQPVVTDFGLARRASTAEPIADPDATTAADPRLTQAGAVVGTPAYMSPEQARGDQEAVGPASDVYALGAILFEMLTGAPPFRGATAAETLRRIGHDELPPMPGVPARLVAVCRTALARDPAARFASMDAFAVALTPFAASRRSNHWMRVAVAAAAGLLLVLAGAVIYVKTDRGTIEVRLSDPAADVRVRIDGGEVVLDDGGRVTRVRAGAHGLEVSGPGFETVTTLFKVKRGETTVVEVELKPTAKPVGPPPAPPGLTPDQFKLAGLLARGEQLIERGRFQELDGVVNEALKLDPQSPGALAQRANLRQQSGDIARAKADAEAALRLNPETPRALLVLSVLLGEEGKFDECIPIETIVTRLWPNNPWGWTNRAQSYFERKEYRQAIADATRAIDLKFKKPDALLTRASAYALLGEQKKAVADYDAATRLAENDPRVYDQRGMLHAQMGNLKLAEADWKKAEELDPARKGEPPGSLPPPEKPPERKKLTADQKGAFERALDAARQAWRQGRIGECHKAVDEACRLDPTSQEARTLRGRVYIQLNRFADAWTEATEALRGDPEAGEARLVRGIAAGGRKMEAAAVADLTIAVRLLPREDPLHAEALSNRANAYGHLGRYHQALVDAEESVRLAPAQALARMSRGATYLHLGEYEKAMADYAVVADAQPGNPQWRIICAALKARLGDATGARAERDRAAAINPAARDAPDMTLPAPPPPIKRDPELPAASGLSSDRD